MLSRYPPSQREARSKGVPSLGSGAIYPVPEDDILVKDFAIPDLWPRAYGLDVGWNRTAAIWGARDPQSGVIYLYSEHYMSQETPFVHAGAIKARGEWIPGVIDPASRGRSQRDGQQLIQNYIDLGLNVTPANNAVEAGIQQVWNLLVSGQLKVFQSLSYFLEEYRKYQRDEKGHIKKVNDHLLDACVVGDTPVITDGGVVAIADLIGRDGLVLSRSGSWARYCGARKTIENAPIVELTFNDGSTVKCTSDHLFLTPAGWVQAVDIKGKTVYNGVSQCIQLSSHPLVRFFRGAGSIFAGNTCNTENRAVDSIGRFTRPIMDRFRRAWTCTTKTTTGSIIERIILSSSGGQSTPGTTKQDTTDRCQWPHCRRQRSGIGHQKESSGIRGTTKEQGTPCTQSENSNAYIVAHCLTRKSPGRIVSAPITAKHSGARRLAWTMRNVAVWFAAALLLRTSTSKQKRAHANAGLTCLQVKDAGYQDVYCLTVPGTQAFCLGNGAVVHNTRYLIMSGRDEMRIKPDEKKSFEQYTHYTGEGESLGWMS
jgi:hypothetical protein